MTTFEIVFLVIILIVSIIWFWFVVRMVNNWRKK